MSIMGRHVSGKVMAFLVIAMVALVGLLPVTTKSHSREIVLVAKNMAFQLDGSAAHNPEVSVKAGEVVRIVLTNEDRGMVHDFAVPAIDVATNILNWNQRDAVTFEAPKEPGTYEYVCRPHLLMMKGVLRVIR
jgi:plastocyanin